jgi:hypothetical protein
MKRNEELRLDLFPFEIACLPALVLYGKGIGKSFNPNIFPP